MVVGRVCRSSRRGRFRHRLRDRAAMPGWLALDVAARERALSALRQPPFALKQRMRNYARGFNWLMAVRKKTDRQEMHHTNAHARITLGYKSSVASGPSFLQSRKTVLPAYSRLAETLDVLAIRCQLARPNPKHSFEPLHNSSMSGKV